MIEANSNPIDDSVITKEVASHMHQTLLRGNLKPVSHIATCSVRCKFCGSSEVVKNGLRKTQIQYYLCHACDRTFAGNNALEGMKYPLAQIAAAIGLFYDGLSIGGIRKQLQSLYHVYPSDSTIYEWIMRFTQVAVKESKFSNINMGPVGIAGETAQSYQTEQKNEVKSIDNSTLV